MVSCLCRRIHLRNIARHLSGWGKGSGKGGGSGGSIRDAGGAFGEIEAAREEQYFRQKQQKQLQELKKILQMEIEHQECLIKQHQQRLEEHKKRQHQIDSEMKDEEEE